MWVERVSLPSLARGRSGAHPALAVSRVALGAVALAAVALSLAGVSLPLRTQAAVYLFGMVALNLPHGGYEHFTNLRRRTPTFRVRYVGAYLTLVAAFLGLFFVAPLAGLAPAIGVACVKGGHGGLNVMRATYGADHLRTRGQRALAVAVRGGVVMLVPIYADTTTFVGFSSIMVSIFDPGAFAAVGGHVETGRLLAGGGWLALAVAHVGLGHALDGGPSWRVDAAETALLGAYFAVVPVVVAVGLYFPLWYSARQVARHDTVDEPGTDDPDGRQKSEQDRNGRQKSEQDRNGRRDRTRNRGRNGDRDLLAADSRRGVALATWGYAIAGAVATGAVVATIWLAAPDPLGGASLLPGLVAFWSITVSIIALPHVVVGSWADREGGIWYVP